MNYGFLDQPRKIDNPEFLCGINITATNLESASAFLKIKN